MRIKLISLLAAGAIAMLGCGNSTTSTSATGAAATSDRATPGGEYFTFNLDGKPMSVPAEDVSTSYYETDSTFKVFAGKDQEMSIVLTVPKVDICPCTIPAGSAEPGHILTQGSVSLLNYPQRPLGFNSWYLTMHDAPPADAIRITDLGAPKDGYRYVAGTFKARVLKTETNGDSPDNRDHEITDGKFRVKHDLHGRQAF